MCAQRLSGTERLRLGVWAVEAPPAVPLPGVPARSGHSSPRAAGRHRVPVMRSLLLLGVLYCPDRNSSSKSTCCVEQCGCFSQRSDAVLPVVAFLPSDRLQNPGTRALHRGHPSVCGVLPSGTRCHGPGSRCSFWEEMRLKTGFV